MSINLDLGENSLFKESKYGNFLLRWLLASVTELLIFRHWLEVIFSNDSWWRWEPIMYLLSRRNLIVWLEGSVEVLSWSLALSFWRCKWMEIKPVIALIFIVGEIQKAPKIYKAAQYYIFLSLLSGHKRGVLL